MPTVAMVEYDKASPEVRAIYDEIMAAKGIDFVPNFWKTLASHPPLLERSGAASTGPCSPAGSTR
ncbi:MAG: carboxymuconolactone decarboxylase family protein [Geminicoccaceae bacterium]|jgi:hypothetical protein|nr:carboxymuconolactone decarboxylase family protein [Geminicoccaceae bacterium]